MKPSKNGIESNKALVQRLNNSELRDYITPILGTVLVFIFGQIFAPGFGSASSIFNYLGTASVLILACLPQTLVILSGNGGIDLSIGALMSLSVAWGGALSGGTTTGLLFSMLCMAGIGALCGLCNGLAINLWGVPAMVVTLSIGSLLDGSYLAVTKGKPAGSIAPFITDFGVGRIGQIRYILIFAVVVIIAVELILRHSKSGKKIYYVGTNARAADLCGMNSKIYSIGIYVLAAICSTIAGFILLGTVGSIQSGAGSEYTMLAVAASVIGGVNIAGGKGTYLGSSLGAVLITVLNGLLIVLQFAEGARMAVKGIVLLAILLAYARGAKLRQ